MNYYNYEENLNCNFMLSQVTVNPYLSFYVIIGKQGQACSENSSEVTLTSCSFSLGMFAVF